ERNEIVIANKDTQCAVTQIAGTVTRRIVSYVKEGDFVQRGGRIGMIRFGSRVDVTIPDNFEVVIRKGDRVRAGETVIAIERSGTGDE
ncbi:phosphatidylserine decarboxylase family protein, partial [Methanosarcinales archaeon]